MSASLTFQNVKIKPVNHKDTVWIKSSDLAKALGYRKTDAISQTYARYADEFTENMTLTLNLSVKGFGSGDSKKPVRVFSLRGCHLIAMFAKTPVAKEFRRWVLDIIEKSGEQSTIESRLSTPTDRVPLKDAVNVLVVRRKINYPTAYGMVNSHFGVKSSKELTVDQLAGAVKYAFDLALDGEVLDDDFTHPLFDEPKKEQDGIHISSGIANNTGVMCHHVRWMNAWFMHHYPALKVLNRKMAVGIIDHFKDASFCATGVAKELGVDLVPYDKLSRFPWDGDYHERSQYLKQA